jgi:ribosomal-protein-alanine N-acetyltransferase
MKYSIIQAVPSDYDGILDVMKVWNMHHIPSSEMAELNIDNFFVAKDTTGKIIGASGYEILSTTTAKTTLLGVFPEYLGEGIGKALQHKRMEVLHEKG